MRSLTITCAHCQNKATRQRYVLEAEGLILKWLCEECVELMNTKTDGDEL